MKIYCILVFSFCLSFTTKTYGAACCGGGSSTSNLISEDESTRVSLGISHKNSSGRSIDFGEAVYSNSTNAANLFALSIVTKEISRFLQYGISTQIASTATGLAKIADTQASVALPIYQNYLYKPFTPDVYLSFVLNMPSGTSFYQSSSTANADALWKLSLNLFTTKSQIFNKWDYLTTTTIEFSKERLFKESQVSFKKGLRLSQALSAGYSFSWAPIRLGIAQSATYNNPNTTVKAGKVQSSFTHLSFPTAIVVSYAINEFHAATLSYENNKFFKSQNADLYQSFGFNFNTRFF